ncbi:multiprotein-bridging factor 1 family protein [Phycisphaerales bacterium AB-hyl4]|uniref:Multiprotein-bridging factor 1 family protein n=1 Tax=Natronomicrosphaera hydrolytica TaxID=3242702 RepID=A0ABV4UBG1_9BACT
MTESLHHPAYRNITEAVKAMRHAAGLSQRDLAAKLGRELSFVSRLEQGQRRLDLLEWVWVCEALGRDPIEEGKAVLAKLRSKNTRR